MRFRETIERRIRATNSSRVLRRDNSRSSHDPITRSKVTLSNKNNPTTISIAGNTEGFATAAPRVMDVSQHTEAREEKSARP